jgi:hypothetical protein
MVGFMALEKRWEAIPSRAFVADGGINPANPGQITLATTIDFRVKQQVILTANSELSLELEVKEITSDTVMYVGAPGSIANRTDLTGFTVAASAQIFALEQVRPQIPEKEYNRAMFEEEPINAQRSILVDDFGNKYNSENPLPVDAQVKPVAIFTIPYDSFDADLTGSTQDIYTSYVGGYPPSAGLTPVGTLVQTATINYTDSTKNNIKNVYRTPFT